ncbi:MAG TPA: RDD family protein [Thermoplasmata archaeon]|nr:RDD family protein [Thermoplasmata archaeon]
MVDPLQLASDVTQTVAYYSLPGVLWLFLYLLAWEEPQVARDAGFGRRTFWLLLPAGVVATVGTVPFFAWDGDVLAVNVAGGIVPILLSTFFLYRLFGRDGSSLGAFLGVLAAETATLFAVVVLLPTGVAWAVAALVAVAFPLGVAVAASAGEGVGPAPSASRIAAPFALTSAVLYATFLTTTPEAGVGIVSVFPYYLLAPIAGGFIAVVVAVLGLGGDGRAGLPLAYAATTFGVLVGADVLRQPPLYGNGSPGLLSIGGAGLGDLLYLSGLLSAATAYLLYRTVRPRAREVPPDVAGAESEPATPAGLLHRAQLLSAGGRTDRSVRKAADAAWAGVQQTRRLYRLPPGQRDRPWEGLPVPPWIEADQRNLDALAASEPTDPREADRAWVTANGILGAASDASRPRFPSLIRRTAAFGLDLGLTVLPALVVWAILVVRTPGNTLDLVGSVGFNASVFGYAGYAFLYFVLSEALFGTTIGKWLLGLEVSDRAAQRPGPVSVVLRNIPKLLPVTVVGVAAALGTAIWLRGALGASPSVGSNGSDALGQVLELLSIGGFVVLGLALCAAVSWLAIYASRERQRAGDYVAGTWVIFRQAPMAPPLPPPGEPARSG